MYAQQADWMFLVWSIAFYQGQLTLNIFEIRQYDTLYIYSYPYIKRLKKANHKTKKERLKNEISNQHSVLNVYSFNTVIYACLLHCFVLTVVVICFFWRFLFPVHQRKDDCLDSKIFA